MDGEIEAQRGEKADRQDDGHVDRQVNREKLNERQ